MSMMEILRRTFQVTPCKGMASSPAFASLKIYIQRQVKILEKLQSESEPRDSDVIRAIQNKLRLDSNEYSYKECRQMALYSEEIAGQNLKYYSKMHTILSRNWKDSFLPKLFITVINHWDKAFSKEHGMRYLHKLFTQKLYHYKGDNFKIKLWKQNRHFFSDEKGALIIGEYLRAQRADSPLKALDLLKMGESYFSAPYFHDVIRTFYYGTKEIPSDLKDVLSRHGDLETKKIVLSDFIIKTKNESQLQSQKKPLRDLALNLIGHPSTPGLWVSAGNDLKIDEKIKSAKRIVNQWLIETYVDVIFTYFINDPKRRSFWLKYAKAEAIEDVKVVGCWSIKNKLSSFDELKESIEYNYIQTQKNENLCAFIMQVKEYRIVEFSDIGNALYIYQDNSKIQELEKRVKLNLYTSVTDLKSTSLAISKYPNEVGNSRFGHYDGWENQLDFWFRRYRGVYA